MPEGESKTRSKAYTYCQINEDLILMQIVLTKIMSVLNNLKAANASLY